MLQGMFSFKSLFRWGKFLLLFWLTTSLVIGSGVYLMPSVSAQGNNNYCQFDESAIAQKKQLREAAINGDSQAQQEYQNLIQRHGEQLADCREQTWPEQQAIWLRLYPCDAKSGKLEQRLDQIVNKGYNEIYVEVFYNSQVLLPAQDNPTSWSSVLRSPSVKDRDLLAEVIEKGHERNLKVYAWLFSLNYGYSYAQRQDRQQVLARNGYGETNIANNSEASKGFIDPYNQQARQEYGQLVSEVVKRNPDGILFDYIRYPRSTGKDSVVDNVKDLWIYSNASLNQLFSRASNEQGEFILRRYVNNGGLTRQDIVTMENMEPENQPPRWQGRDLSSSYTQMSIEARQNLLERQLWYFTVAHAAQGVIDFLEAAVQPAKAAGIPTGAVFFPDANRMIGQAGFDSRLQPWNRFQEVSQWHPMVYAVCGNTKCITEMVASTLEASDQMDVVPALAGRWGQSYDNHPPLEAQMAAIRRRYSRIDEVSHFSYGWQFPEEKRERQFCSVD